MLLSQEKENKLSTQYKSSPFTVSKKSGNSVLVEADGVKYRRNVTHLKKYLERDDHVYQETTQCPPSQESREPEKVSYGTANEGSLAENRQSEDRTMQSDSTTLRPARVKRLPSRFQDYVLGYISAGPD